MVRYVIALVLFATSAVAQTVPGRFPAGTVYGNPTAAETNPATVRTFVTNWTTAGRPAAPNIGDFGYNSTLDRIEFFSGETQVLTGSVVTTAGAGCSAGTITITGTAGTGNAKFTGTLPVTAGAIATGTAVTLTSTGIYSVSPTLTNTTYTISTGSCTTAPRVDITVGNVWNSTDDGVVDIKSFGAKCDATGDDSAAINAAIAYAKAVYNWSNYFNMRIQGSFKSACRILNTINLTGIVPAVSAHPMVVSDLFIYCLPTGGGKPCIDALGSRNIQFRDITIAAGDGTNDPTYGIQTGVITAAVYDQIKMDNVQLFGNFSVCALYNYGNEVSSYRNVHVVNQKGGYAGCFDGNNKFNITSQFVTQTLAVNTPVSFTQIIVRDSSFGSRGGAGDPVPLWIGGISDSLFDAVYLCSACNAVGTSTHGIDFDLFNSQGSGTRNFVFRGNLEQNGQSGAANAVMFRQSGGASFNSTTFNLYNVTFDWDVGGEATQGIFAIDSSVAALQAKGFTFTSGWHNLQVLPNTTFWRPADVSKVSILGGNVNISGSDFNNISATTAAQAIVGANSSVTFTVSAGLGLQVGNFRVRAIPTGNTSYYMEGRVSSYSGTTLVLQLDEYGCGQAPCTGTFTTWTLNTQPLSTFVGAFGGGWWNLPAGAFSGIRCIQGDCRYFSKSFVFDNVAAGTVGRSDAERAGDDINPMDYGALCAANSNGPNANNDDAPAINAAIMAARQIWRIAPGTPGKLKFPNNRLCLIKSTLNFTGQSDATPATNVWLAFRGRGFVVEGMRLFCQTAGTACVDVMGSCCITWRDVNIWGDARILFDGTTTSTTSTLIGTGSKTFTVAAGLKNLNPGQPVEFRSHANPNTNFMQGQVTSYSGTSLVANILVVGGSGTLADWDIYRPWMEATTGIQIGRTFSNEGAGEQMFDRVIIDGSYTLGSLYNFAAEEVTYLHTYLHNWDATLNVNNYSLILDGNLHFNPATIAPAGQRIAAENNGISFNGNAFYNVSVQSDSAVKPGIFVGGPGQYTFDNFYNSIGLGTSATSNTIGTGSKTFTMVIGADQGYRAGMAVTVVQPFTTNWMKGTITSYTVAAGTTATMVVNVTSTNGSGTIASWYIQYDNACNVDLYFFIDTFYDNQQQGLWDAHFEAQPTHNFCIIGKLGATLNPIIDRFRFATDQAVQTYNSIFFLDASRSSIFSTPQTMTFNGFDIDIDSDGSVYHPKLFDDPTKYFVTGANIRLYDQQMWNEPARFNGQVCMPWSLTVTTFTAGNRLECAYSVPTPPLNRNPDFILDQWREGLISSDARFVGTGGATTFITDGWRQQSNGGMSATALSFQRTTPGIDGNNYFLEYKVVTQTSPTAAQGLFAITIFDAVDFADVRSGWSINGPGFNIDTWIYASITGDYPITILNGGRFYTFNFTVTAANTWQWVHKHIPTDNPGGGSSSAVNQPIIIYVPLAAGSSLLQTAGNMNTWTGTAGYGSPTMVQFANQTVGSTLRFTQFRVYPGLFQMPYQRPTFQQTIARQQRWFSKSLGQGQPVGDGAGGYLKTFSAIAGSGYTNGGGTTTVNGVGLGSGSNPGCASGNPSANVQLVTGTPTLGGTTIGRSGIGCKVGDVLTDQFGILTGGTGFTLTVGSVNQSNVETIGQVIAATVGNKLYKYIPTTTTQYLNVSDQNQMSAFFWNPGRASTAGNATVAANVCRNLTKDQDSGAVTLEVKGDRGFLVSCTQVAGDAVGDLLGIHWAYGSSQWN